MKWIGQHIYDQISRFRNHTYFEDSITLSTGKTLTMDEYTSGTIGITKIQDSGTAFNDNDTSLMTAGAIDDRIAELVTAEDLDTAGDSGTGAVDLNSQSLTIAGGTNATSVAGSQTVTINVDDAFITNSEPDTMAVSDFGATAALTIDANQPATAGAEDSKGLYIDYDRIVAGSGTAAHNDIGIDLDVNTASLGVSSVYGMDIDVVGATSGTHTATGIDLNVSGADRNTGIQITATGTHLKLIASADVNDYATLEVADTGDLTIATFGDGTTDSDLTLDADGDIKLEPATGDVTIYDAVNDGNPTISLGSSATNRLEIKSVYNSGAQTLCDIDFTTYTASGTANDGRFNFYVDEVLTTLINDSGLYVYGSLGNIQGQGDGATLSAYDTTTSSATEGGKLRLIANDGAVLADNHRLGVIEFYGAEDGSNTISVGARIQAIARDAWDGSNNDADLEFYTTDGTTESKVLTLDADKLATFAGAVTVTGALTCTTDLATDQQKHLAWFTFRGYGTADGTNYEAPEILSTSNSPFEHDTSFGSDGLTAQEPRAFIKAGAYVMPRAGTLKNWTGWAASAGSGTIDMSLFKATLTRNSTTAVTPVLLKNTQFTALGNTKLEDFAETSFSVAFAAGDVIYTAVKGGTNNKLWYLDSTLEVEWD